MTYILIWRNEARQALSRLRAADSRSAKLVTAAVRALALDPRPEGSAQLGASWFWRLKRGELRVTYEVDDDHQTVQIYSVGQMPPARQR